MAKTITIKLSGLAEDFMNKMREEGLNEADVIAQGIGLMEEVWRTGRVALLREDSGPQAAPAPSWSAPGDTAQMVQHYYHIRTPASMNRRESGSAGSGPSISSLEPA
jgi:hypothetical protein